jgi:hypothetical protein
LTPLLTKIPAEGRKTSFTEVEPRAETLDVHFSPNPKGSQSAARRTPTNGGAPLEENIKSINILRSQQAGILARLASLNTSI